MLKCLLLTSNIGSLISKPHLEPEWMQQICDVLATTQPDVFAIHLQEINGQVGSSHASRLENFLRTLLERIHLEHSSQRGFVIFNSEGTSVDDPEFAALGSIYWFRTDRHLIESWDYTACRFVPSTDEIVSRIPNNRLRKTSGSHFGTHLDQKRFPADMSPSGIASRKGFIRTRWRIDGCVVEFVNVHLFNDSDNVISVKEHPSIYAQCRARGMRWLMELINSDSLPGQHVAIFGDFNFRLNLPALLERLCHGEQASLSLELLGPDGTTCLHPLAPKDCEPDAASLNAKTSDQPMISNCDINPTVIIGRRVFDLHGVLSDRWKYSEDLLSFDTEMDVFADQLKELPITFPPSYPFDAASSNPHAYARTRCPAWCDRILFSPNMLAKLRPSIEPSGSTCPVTYDMLAKDSTVGDHKPVYLYFSLDTSPG
ncbi:Type I inositol 1,4,5-trisphosphate 5-phosphatase [Clonorchis sinensis]|uniref:inositol-polyphosphate 5-phosphatase n=2 Tax=Clonorchis sinensis TaxID=79923 RepID=A0A8T1MCH1_CLOSI|nr:Type I inositol 1,4,5-trisphosphate 5-phosphatase [Clonorchis sinensis]